MGCTLKALGVQSLALLAVTLLLLTSLGPLFDHHFAERFPAHGHLFLGAAGEEHTHPFEHSHVHYDAMYAPVPGDGSVIFFAPNDGVGYAHAVIAAPAALPLTRFDGDGGSILRSRSYATALLSGVTVSPVVPPPKV